MTEWPARKVRNSNASQEPAGVLRELFPCQQSHLVKELGRDPRTAIYNERLANNRRSSV